MLVSESSLLNQRGKQWTRGSRMAILAWIV